MLTLSPVLMVLLPPVKVDQHNAFPAEVESVSKMANEPIIPQSDPAAVVNTIAVFNFLIPVPKVVLHQVAVEFVNDLRAYVDPKHSPEVNAVSVSPGVAVDSYKPMYRVPKLPVDNATELDPNSVSNTPFSM